VGLDAEHVVPRTGGGPHLVVLQQIGVDEHAQVGLVTKGRYAAVVVCISVLPRFRETAR
jgi:hypothetical protein